MFNTMNKALHEIVSILQAVLGVTRYLCNLLHNIITFVVTK